MKKIFVEAEIEVIAFAAEDIITASNSGSGAFDSEEDLF